MEVDYLMLFNIALGAASFLGGWVLNNMTKAIERLDKDVRDMPHTYVSRDDFRDMRDAMRGSFDKIDTTLGTIFKRLERKEDKN